MALAMAGGSLPADKNFAVSINWGTFEGQNAFAGTAHARLTDNLFINGGVGVGASDHTVGGRAGLMLAW
ncbi:MULTISPECIES: YadA-like family protein [unclassified Mesorhizobium]|nr:MULTISPECIES: YadA-like family protein [unclassified Mesorhizobium]